MSLSLSRLAPCFQGLPRRFEMPQLEWHVNAEIRLLYSKFFLIVKATCNDAAAALFLTLSTALLFLSTRYRLPLVY
jgi:hypothetical protein